MHKNIEGQKESSQPPLPNRPSAPTDMESLEDLQTRHRKEQKDLQGRLTQKKKGATKKTRKGVNSECEELERQLKERQTGELSGRDEDTVPDVEDVPELDEDPADPADVDGLADSLGKTSVAEPPPSEGGPKKRNRQKERLARRVAEQEAAVEQAKKEAASQPDQKAVERARMLEEFQARGLAEKSIRPDGHCLFSAIADQLSQASIPLAPASEGEVSEDQRYKVVRQAAAAYMEAHPDDFAAWLDEPLPSYVEKIRDTAEWGGHLELLALAKNYNVEITVLQNGPDQKIEPGTEGEPVKICLAYYRHGFGLGEHYNSLRKNP